MATLFYLLSFLHSKKNQSHASRDALLLLTISNAVVHWSLPYVPIMEQLLMEKPMTGTVPSSSLSIHGAHVFWSGQLCTLTFGPSLHCGSAQFNDSTSRKYFCLAKTKEHFPPKTIPNQLNSVPSYISLCRTKPSHLRGFPDLL